MDKLYNIPFTLSSKGRVSLSPEILPIACQQAACSILDGCLKGLQLRDEELLRFLQDISIQYQSGMSEAAFVLRARAAVHAWAQRFLADVLSQDENQRRHIRDTLCRCLPALLITDDLVTRCEQYVRTCTVSRWDICPVIQFAALAMLESPAGKHPLWTRLHESSLRLLPDAIDVTRDDLRLVVLDALYDPSASPDVPVPAYLDLRLGRTGAPLSIEAIAAHTHLPPVYLREVEEGLLQTLIRSVQMEESHA